jgi:MFS superfamily sulfate permease-like transporter
MSFIGKLGLVAFLIFSGLIILAYFSALYEKIIRPNFKNLNNKEFMWAGIIVLVLIIIDFFNHKTICKEFE